MNDDDWPSDVSLLRQFAEGNGEDISEEAASEFCARYMAKLMSLVQRNLAGRFAARVDAEDIVQSVLRTWFRRTQAGNLAPASTAEVWKLLSVIALCKVRNKVKFHDAQRRAVARTQGDSEVLGAVPDPTDQDAIEFLDTVRAAGQKMDPMARRTLELILEDRSVEEIAAELGRTTKSVQRYKKQIGTVLAGLLEDAP